MTKAALEKAQVVHLALARVSGFLETLSDGDPTETNLLVTVYPPADKDWEFMRDLPNVDVEGMHSAKEPVSVSSVDYLRETKPPQHPLIAEFYSELAGWLLERLPALEAELKQEFEAL